MGSTSLILGIISLIMLVLGIFRSISFGAIPTILAISGIITGIKDIMEKKRNGEDYKQAIIGVILCFIYVIAFIIIAATSVASMNRRLNNF